MHGAQLLPAHSMARLRRYINQLFVKDHGAVVSSHVAQLLQQPWPTSHALLEFLTSSLQIPPTSTTFSHSFLQWHSVCVRHTSHVHLSSLMHNSLVHTHNHFTNICNTIAPQTTQWNKLGPHLLNMPTLTSYVQHPCTPQLSITAFIRMQAFLSHLRCPPHQQLHQQLHRFLQY